VAIDTFCASYHLLCIHARLAGDGPLDQGICRIPQAIIDVHNLTRDMGRDHQPPALRILWGNRCGTP